MEQELFKAILASTYTQTGMKRTIKDIEHYLNQKLFSVSVHQRVSASDKQTSDTPIFRYSDILDFVTPQNFEAVIKKLKSWADTLPVLVINVPIDLPDEEVAKLGQNLRSSYSNILIEVKINPSLIAGCSLVYKGVLRDYSIRSRIEANKNQILKSFLSFLK